MARDHSAFDRDTINPNKQFAALRYFRRKAKRRSDTDRINRRNDKDGGRDSENVQYDQVVSEYYG